MRLDIVTPERRLVSSDVTSVMIPGAEGDMTILADHAPVITTLRPGILKVEGASGAERYAVTGGFAEITAEGTSVLAEQAMLASEMTQEMIDVLVTEADANRKVAGAELQDAATKLVADMMALGAELGLSPRVPSA